MPSLGGASAMVIVCAVIGIIWGFINIILIRKTDMTDSTGLRPETSDDVDEQIEEDKKAFGETHSKGSWKKEEGSKWELPKTPDALLQRMLYIGNLIENGAKAFLHNEYAFLYLFLVVFGVIIYFAAEPFKFVPFTTVAFFIGGTTSIIAGYIGMRVAVYANVRTTRQCARSIHEGFIVAFRGGEVLGFMLVGLALLILIILLCIYHEIIVRDCTPDKALTCEFKGFKGARVLFPMLYDALAGFGLGGSTVALFGRVGGGIYTKAADVGSDLVGKVVAGLDEDSPKNPGVIADNVGDNVGDVAGMGADLFGSLAESTCAALVVSATCAGLFMNGSILFPLLVTSSGVLTGILCVLVATNFVHVTKENVQTVLKWQIGISTILETIILWPIAATCLPEQLVFYISPTLTVTCSWIECYFCVFAGLWSGLIIGFFTEYFTSNEYNPVQEIAEASRTGEAPNIIYGLALGYLSVIIPIICIAATIFIAFITCHMYGVALGALGMLSTLPVALTIDGYGPISDNAGGIAELSGLHKDVRRFTDKLDAAGNTTAAVGKGFAIGSACLVALALFGAFVTRTKLTSVDILEPLQFSGLIIGAMLPYAFSALTMKAVGIAAKDMIVEIKTQMQNNEDILKGKAEPDYNRCISISTKASLRKMIAPGILVIFTPILTGLFLGPRAVAGVLAGNIVSGVQVAVSFSNTGGAWDNAKKYIEEGVHESKEVKGHVFAKGSAEHKAAVIGDTVGDPLKDTSGPSINILIKLSAITSLVFGGFFTTTHFLVSGDFSSFSS